MRGLLMALGIPLLLSLTSPAAAQVTPIGPFVGTASEGFETVSAAAGCVVPGIFGGTTSMCTPGNLGANITGGWGFVCFVGARSGSHMYGSSSGFTRLTFTDPVTQFGAYFSANSGTNSFTIEFFDSTGALIDSVWINMGAGCVWTWYGFDIPAGAAYIDVIGDYPGGGFVMMDDMEAIDNPDVDGDGVNLADDNCPQIANPLQEDVDGDVVGDVCDNCVFQANLDQADADADGMGDVCECIGGPGNDIDADGTADDCDNCELVYNPNQEDFDGDQVGNDCDICPDDMDPLQLDVDADTHGDACDICPAAADPNQEDADGDLIGDACDPCPTPADPFDSDGDTVCDGVDICVDGDDFLDTDADLVPDYCDICPLDSPDDTDGDGTCDSDDICPMHDDSGPDADHDAYVDGCDNCTVMRNADQSDIDEDGSGDVCDCATSDPTRHPGADELCNERDDDCDNQIDEDPVDGVTFYEDIDGDGHGNAAVSKRTCGEAPTGFVDNDDDCDDTDALAFVGNPEVCDGVDNDCSGGIDDLDDLDECGDDGPANRDNGGPAADGGADRDLASSCGCDGVGGAMPVIAGLLVPVLLLRRRR